MHLQTLTASTSQEQQTPAAARVVLTGVSWHFKALLADIGDNRACRLAYNQGILEILAPYQEHEAPKIMIGSFVEALADELNIEIMQLGSLLLEREDLRRAVEPDICDLL